jgi:hypothetical protein
MGELDIQTLSLVEGLADCEVLVAPPAEVN